MTTIQTINIVSTNDFKLKARALYYAGYHVSESIFDICCSKSQFTSFKSLKTALNSRFECLGLCSDNFSKRKASDFISNSRDGYQKVQGITQMGTNKKWRQ